MNGELPSTVSQILTPRPRLTVSEWAAQAPFMIREKGAVRPGPYDLSWTPFWREPLDCVSDPTVRKMNWVASSQCGKTKAGEVITAYVARHRAANMMYVRPTEDDVVEALRDRFRPMLETNLPDLIPGGEWMTLSKNPVIVLASMMIYGAAATIARQLTSRTTLFNWFDEIDSGGDTGNDLGNVLDLLDERQMAGSASRIFTLGSSTPKLETGSNFIAYQQSDQREYWEPCPHCGHYQPLRLAQIKAKDGERDPELIRRHGLGYYECAHCKRAIEDNWKSWMCDRGRHVPARERIVEPLPIHNDDIVEHGSLELTTGAGRWEPRREGEPPQTSHRGYRIWRANTKFELASFSNILARWFEVSRSKDPERLQVFVNNWLAEPWKVSIAAADEELIKSRIGVYEPRSVPTRAKIILGYVDVQAASLWYAFRAFGPNQESWLIQYGTVEVAADKYLDAMDTIYRMAFYHAWPLAGSEQHEHMRAYAIAVDSGFKPDEVYEFARRPCVIATKGLDIADYRIRVTQVEGKKRPDPLSLYLVNTRALKDRLQRFIRAGEGEPGVWHLHRDTTQEYVDQLTSEHLVPKERNPKIKTWQPKTKGRPNHLLDCEAGVLALAEALEQRREVSIMSLMERDPPLGVFRRAPDEVVDPLAPRPTSRRRRIQSTYVGGGDPPNFGR